ncbi:MAG: hypothetical protein KF866_09580 [Phycisphaeraceae bacterium]|nr:hypothetical protein [Phycisphaeraceae bacterium]
MNRALALSSGRAIMIGAVGLAVANPASFAQTATFEGLGYLGSNPFSRARGVSADGNTVVGVTSIPEGGSRAFRWTRTTGMVSLGALDGQSLPSDAFAASADGSVIVGQSGVLPFGFMGFRWTEADGMVGLGHLGTTPSTSATGISADGSVVVGRSVSAAIGNEAYRWTADTGMVGLGPIPGGGGTNARNISADGTVIVGVGTAAGGRAEAWRWTEDTGIVGIGRLPGPPWAPDAGSSSAAAISADNSTIVGLGIGEFGQAEAFKWRVDTGIFGLGIPFFALATEAYGVSENGNIVVGEATIDFDEEWVSAFIDRGDGIELLEDVLRNDFGVDLGTWILAAATGITPDGRVIVGWGHPDGDRYGEIEAFMVVFHCPADLSGSSDPNIIGYGQPDGIIDAADFFYYLDQFVAGNLAVADLTGSSDPNDPAYGVPDGQIDATDFFYFLDIFVVGCP